MHMKRCLLCIGLSAGFVFSTWGQDWPQFRGPSGDGVASAKNLPTTWSASNNIAWEVKVPGRGRSSPVILGDRIWLTTAIEHNPRNTRVESDPVVVVDRAELGLVCLERASGKQLYHVTFLDVEKPPPAHEFNSFATPTPVAEPGRIYCDFGTFGTLCAEAETGKILWQNKLPIDHQLAPGSSPVIWKDMLILVRDGREKQFVAGLDKNTGKIIWQTDRPPIKAGSGNQKKSFSTPLIVQTGDRAQAVIPGGHWICSYDPETGRELWRVKHGTGFSIGPRPVSGNGLVYALTGMTRQLFAIRPDGSGDVTATHVAWKAGGAMPTMPSPLLVGKEIYVVSDSGLLTCLDAMTGKEIGQRGMGGQCASSPMFADGRIYMFTREGKGVVMEPGKDLKIIAENKLAGPIFASPVALGDTLYVRSDSSLYCIRGK